MICANLHSCVDNSMGFSDKCSWNDRKRALNLNTHGYDFAELDEAFDGRPVVTRRDDRFDYGELRYNALVELRGRVVNITFTPRAGRIHLISARPASREERASIMPKRNLVRTQAKGSDWRRIDALTDAEIERMAKADRDNPATTSADWAEAVVGLPPLKTPVNAKFDVDVVDWFKSQGRGYQTRMNAVLRHYMEKHKKAG